MTIQPTTEFAATSPEVISAIVQELRTSPRRLAVFEAVYSGGKRAKTSEFLSKKTGLLPVVVLQLATQMAHKQFFEHVKENGRVGYRKYTHINAVKDKILRGARSKKLSVHREGAEPRSRITGTARPVRGPRKTSRSLDRPRRRYDVFVSYASEDKKFVVPLVKALKRAKIRVWYDNDMMGWGDDLRRSIDRGLANCRYGIVVFSKAFLRGKKWTEHELDGLFAKERLGREVILPIWHKVTRADLEKYSPAFADRIARNLQRDSIQDIVRGLKEILKEGK